MNKKRLLDPQYIKQSTLKYLIEKQRPLFEELKQIADSENLNVFAKNLPNDYVKKFNKNYEDIPVEKMLDFKGKLEPFTRIKELLKTIEHLPLYKSKGALNEYIQNNIHQYTSDPEILEVLNDIDVSVTALNNLHKTKGEISDLFFEFGFEWDPYNKGGYLFNGRIHKAVETLKAKNEYQKHLKKVS